MRVKPSKTGSSVLLRSHVPPSSAYSREESVTVPITAWLPFAIAVFGIYDASALFLIGLGAFYPIVVNTTHGVRDTNLLLLRAARMLGISRPELSTEMAALATDRTSIGSPKLGSWEGHQLPR
mgnify:CR=1 FL=1